ncbi:MAG TPA: peroxiredoxin [Steroidobacteraceae bacterium]|nr:peroxiredoxin [Steroidobacteraceae bacterium]
MNRLLLAGLLSCAVSAQALAALPVGATAPAFKTQASLAGKEFTYDLGKALKKGPVVVYFYPGAFTGGCNIQAHTFAENMDKFKSAGATVIGVSLDKIETLNAFSSDPQYCAGKLPVASDADGSIAKSFDLTVRGGPPGMKMKDTRGIDIDHQFAERTTFIVTQDGKIAAEVATVNGMTPAGNVEKSLQIVQDLAAGKPVS